MLLLHLRIFESFAVLINLIFRVFKEILIFGALFMLVIAAFGNAMFVLAMLDEPFNSEDKITGPNIMTAFMWTFRQTQSPSTFKDKGL